MTKSILGGDLELLDQLSIRVSNRHAEVLLLLRLTVLGDHSWGLEFHGEDRVLISFVLEDVSEGTGVGALLVESLGLPEIRVHGHLEVADGLLELLDWHEEEVVVLDFAGASELVEGSSPSSVVIVPLSIELLPSNRVSHLDHIFGGASLCWQSDCSKNGVGVSWEETMLSINTTSNHSVLFLVALGDGLDDIGVIHSLNWVVFDRHAGQGSKRLGGETTIEVRVVNVHLGEGLFDEDGPPGCVLL